MENLPQNENNNEILESSTIFSDPVSHKQRVKTGKGKKLLKALSLLLIVAIIIGGTVAVIKFIPEKEDTKVTANDKIELLDYADSEIKEITVKNKNGSFNIYSKVVETKDESMNETVSETFWYLKGYDTTLTDSAALQTIVDAAVDIDAIRIIESKTAKDCGLEKPVVSVAITSNEGKKITVDIGNKSPDNVGVYLKLSDSENIYLVGSMLDEKLTFKDLDMASTDPQAAITLDEKYDEYLSDDKIISCDSFTVSGRNFPQKVSFVMNKDEKLAGYIPYYLTTPMQRTAENGDPIFSLFYQGFPVAGAYSYDVKKSTLKELGLNEPDFEVSAKFGDFTYTYRFKEQRKGEYAVVGTDSKNVKKVLIDDCGFLAYRTADFYSKIVFITPIDSVNSLKIATADKTYLFNITAASSTNEDNKKYIIECDGKTYNSTYFQSYYQFLCGLESMEFDVTKTTEKPSLTLTYTYNDRQKKPSVIEFVKINATKYQYSVDGVPMGKIGSTSYNKILKNLERLLDGKQIVVN